MQYQGVLLAVHATFKQAPVSPGTGPQPEALGNQLFLPVDRHFLDGGNEGHFIRFLQVFREVVHEVVGEAIGVDDDSKRTMLQAFTDLDPWKDRG